ncbi:MAG: hypothetical protein NTV89_05255 [Proteobacteria bacterium]|nr:hypothetical protein [Pseudomonadota bacterium]
MERNPKITIVRILRAKRSYQHLGNQLKTELLLTVLTGTYHPDRSVVWRQHRDSVCVLLCSCIA